MIIILLYVFGCVCESQCVLKSPFPVYWKTHLKTNCKQNSMCILCRCINEHVHALTYNRPSFTIHHFLLIILSMSMNLLSWEYCQHELMSIVRIDRYLQACWFCSQSRQAYLTSLSMIKKHAGVRPISRRFIFVEKSIISELV